MSSDRTTEYYTSLVNELRNLPSETEWVEFKHNKCDPRDIGEYLSALANSSALLGKVNAYVIWGINDRTHDVVGTSFKPSDSKVGNEELENWLLKLLSPKIHFRFLELTMEGKPVVILEIPAATPHPVRFDNTKYIRVGSYKKRLKDHPEKERELWRIFDRVTFEQGIAAEHVSSEKVLRLLNFPSYFDLLELPLPDGKNAILDALKEEKLIHHCQAGDWNITNMGAILFAKSINSFQTLKRKAMRVIQYKGAGRVETQREHIAEKGYACGFESLIDYIKALVPSNEIITQSLRKTVPMYPEVAIRELVANALIHQDFFISGTGPMVEIFDDRIEVTNPGEPLVSIERFLDTPPKSRNEGLASLLRRFRICEERGSGIDKVVLQTELYQLPAPLFEVPEGFTRTVLFAHKPLEDMTRTDRVRACYLHACLQYVQRKSMTNMSLRERFGLDESKTALISRILNATIEAGLINKISLSESRRDSSYVPFWAQSNV